MVTPGLYERFLSSRNVLRADARSRRCREAPRQRPTTVAQKCTSSHNLTEDVGKTACSLCRATVATRTRAATKTEMRAAEKRARTQQTLLAAAQGYRYLEAVGVAC